MRITMAVELVEPAETLQVSADARDLRQWEVWAMKQRPQLPLKPDGAQFPQTLWTTRLAFTAAVRDGYEGTWESFEERCAGIEPVDEETEDEDPTKAGPGPA